MSSRLESTPKAHQDTFGWIFRDDDPKNQPQPWNSFTNWLKSTDNANIYWITGKPGSGKSTFMKYLAQDPRILLWLGQWSDGYQLIKAGFYFWNSGTAMQMSRMGLLRALLHSSLKTDLALIMHLFGELWEQFITFRGGRDEFTWPELRCAFKSLVSDKSRKFFFLIDGLDEFDGSPDELIKLIIEASARPNVKICTASRPWLPFEDAFKNRPGLLLEQLTHKDISLYVSSKFDENLHYTRLKRRQLDHASNLVRNVINKASGVFLWVYLVVESLLQGLSNSDRVLDLQNRLNALPGDLEALFDNLLDRIDPVYFKQSARYSGFSGHIPHPLCYNYRSRMGKTLNEASKLSAGLSA
ncbi:hypothetical protein AOQ84DRAFT_372706 [Glonium stellatum]|uniref:Nephrocystin 3-like N-terminal domain-containing protein n=1 Tax=Glonium stellatum TaxID=574774 RepID=A0A8E2JXJ4_9PEZI|nr:hypothetical protein AOQ84DRAFT_372706 [Glonium stellatum]